MPTVSSYLDAWTQLCVTPDISTVTRTPPREQITLNHTCKGTSATGADVELSKRRTLNAIQITDGTTVAAIKSSVEAFLDRLSYRAPQTPQSPNLRRKIAAEILSWNDSLSEPYITGLTDTSCTIAETAYTHTSYHHQFLVALCSAYVVYADDLGQRDVEALGRFVQRFTRGQAQPTVVFERLTTFLGTLYEYYPRISADAIITNTLDGLTGMYVELVTKGDKIHPAAHRYPFYLRLKAGLGCAYAHFNFTKSWGEAMGNYYLQLIPELELVIVGINLSFHKETLAGETDNYVHLRAAVEQKSPITVLQELVDENVESIRKIEKLAACQTGLAEICHSFIMGYIEFYFNARRYRLEEVVDVARYTST